MGGAKVSDGFLDRPGIFELLPLQPILEIINGLFDEDPRHDTRAGGFKKFDQRNGYLGPNPIFDLRQIEHGRNGARREPAPERLRSHVLGEHAAHPQRVAFEGREFFRRESRTVYLNDGKLGALGIDGHEGAIRSPIHQRPHGHRRILGQEAPDFSGDPLLIEPKKLHHEILDHRLGGRGPGARERGGGGVEFVIFGIGQRVPEALPDGRIIFPVHQSHDAVQRINGPREFGDPLVLRRGAAAGEGHRFLEEGFDLRLRRGVEDAVVPEDHGRAAAADKRMVSRGEAIPETRGPRLKRNAGLLMIGRDDEHGDLMRDAVEGMLEKAVIIRSRSLRPPGGIPALPMENVLGDSLEPFFRLIVRVIEIHESLRVEFLTVKSKQRAVNLGGRRRPAALKGRDLTRSKNIAVSKLDFPGLGNRRLGIVEHGIETDFAERFFFVCLYRGLIGDVDSLFAPQRAGGGHEFHPREREGLGRVFRQKARVYDPDHRVAGVLRAVGIGTRRGVKSRISRHEMHEHPFPVPRAVQGLKIRILRKHREALAVLAEGLLGQLTEKLVPDRFPHGRRHDDRYLVTAGLDQRNRLGGGSHGRVRFAGAERVRV